MITVKRFLAAAAVLLFSLAPLPLRAETPLSASAPPRPLMWVIRDADSTLYLFGTIHAMRPDAAWFTPAVQQRLDDSGELWLEIADMDDTARMLSVTLPFVIDKERRMTDGLSAEDIAALDRHLAPYGMNHAQLMGMRKWAVGLMLVQKQFESIGLTSENGIDMTLLRRARETGKPVKGFETPEEQLALLAPDDPAEEADGLRATLKELDAGPDMIEGLIDAWLAGDQDTLERHLVTEMKQDDPKGYDRFLAARNRNWVPKIEQILAGRGTVFIAVGGAHLTGPDSVIALLREKGVRAEPVDTAP
jgi:uncharacterized protein